MWKAGITEFDPNPFHRQTEHLGCDLRQDGIRPGADVGHRHFDGRDAIGTQSDIGLGQLKRVAAGRRGHAHSHQPASVANLARLRVALVPSKSARAFLQAGDQVTAGIRNMLLRILARLVAHPQFDRVELEFFGQFVHRAFKRHQPDGFAGRTH